MDTRMEKTSAEETYSDETRNGDVALVENVMGSTTLYGENGQMRFVPMPTPDPKGTKLSIKRAKRKSH